MADLWGRLTKHTRIVKQATVPYTGDRTEAMAELCHALDLPRPLWFQKQEREWAEFSQTYFLEGAFVEHFPYDRLEIERVDVEEPKKRSKDPRNG